MNDKIQILIVHGELTFKNKKDCVDFLKTRKNISRKKD